MTLPLSLLAAILDVTADEADQERLARRWRRTVQETTAAAARIRAQVAARRCRCEIPAVAPDGRCSRCLGLTGGSVDDA